MPVMKSKPTRSFLTGSRVYGTPTAKSDIDLVVLVSEDDLAKLCVFDEDADAFSHYADGRSIRFGKLNLLCVTKQEHFDVWREGTDELEKIKPVTRDFAIEFLRNLRRQHKIEGW